MPDPSPAQGAVEPSTTDDKPTPNPRVWIPSTRPTGWTIAALTFAVLAGALAIAAWFNPLSSFQHFSGQQTADAKDRVCQAYALVHRSVVTNTHLQNPAPNDPAGELAVAVNARMALLGGGDFLSNRLTVEPATPAELSQAVTATIGTLEELGTGYLAGTDNTLEPLRHTLDTQMTQLNRLCA